MKEYKKPILFSMRGAHAAVPAAILAAAPALIGAASAVGVAAVGATAAARAVKSYGSERDETVFDHLEPIAVI